MAIECIKKNDYRISYLKKRDEKLGWLIDMVGEISYWKTEDYFEFLIDEIVGQMLSNQVAKNLRDKLQNCCGGKITPDAVLNLSNENLRGIGLAYSKVQYIHNIASLVKSGDVILDDLGNYNDEEVVQYLTSIKGIGPWTAKMFLLFALERPDVLPYEDKAFLQAYKWLYRTDDIRVEAVKRTCCNWTPYSSLAARYMYRALDGGFTKNNR